MTGAIFDPSSRVAVPTETLSENVSNDMAENRRNIAVWVNTPRPYGGSQILIGFDTEYQDIGGRNDVLSYQFYACDPTGTIEWDGIYYPKTPSRVKLAWFIEHVIAAGFEQRKLSRWPKHIYFIGHFSLADLVTFDDFEHLKTEFDAIRRTYASITQPTAITCWDATRHKHPIKLVLRDTMLLAPAGMQKLKNIGDLVGIPKLDLNPGEIKNMRALLTSDQPRFEDYALRDPKIAVRYCLKIIDINRDLMDLAEIPPTLSTMGISHLLNIWEQNGMDKHSILSTEEIDSREWVPTRGQYITQRKIVPTADRDMFEKFATECYHGGRNEQYFFGASAIGDWIDFDLCGAYTTAMTMIGMPHWDQILTTKDINAFQPEVLGYARVKFSFPDNTRFPCLPVRTTNGLVYPLEGESFCCSPEIHLAQTMGAQLEILHGVILPADLTVRPFETFIVDCTRRRKSYPKKSLNELFWKELSNSTYGKTAQGLKQKRVFDARSGDYQDLPPSRVTNPYFAAYVTSFVRAALGELLHRLPSHVHVSNATTDGFLSTATEAEALAASQGIICQLFAKSRIRICGTDTVLEAKHQIRQVLGWRTRGQATLIPAPDKALVLAKAGLQAPMSDQKDQNQWIIQQFVNRTENTTLVSRRLRTLPDIYKHGGDLVNKVQTIRVSMEFDWKRRPSSMTTRPINRAPHLYFDTVPWRTVAEFTACREQWVNFASTEGRVLKSESDLTRFNDYRSTVSVSGVQKPRDCTAITMARRMFLRAYVRSVWGLDANAMSYAKVAAWLTELGYPTKKSDLENANRPSAKLKPNLVLLTPVVRNFVAQIRKRFPTFEPKHLLQL